MEKKILLHFESRLIINSVFHFSKSSEDETKDDVKRALSFQFLPNIKKQTKKKLLLAKKKEIVSQ